MIYIICLMSKHERANKKRQALDAWRFLIHTILD